MTHTAWIDSAIVFLPLLGAVLAGIAALFGREGVRRDRFAQGVSCACALIAAGLASYVFMEGALSGGAARRHVLAPWFEMGGVTAFWTVSVDMLTVVMFAVVTLVSAMVHLYAVGYMKGDKGVARFMAFLSLFTFFMLMLTCADNLLQMFFGWEGVGLCSYLLIGFWHERTAARAAAMKAFWMNRIGDLGFLLGIFGCLQVLGAADFAEIFKNAPQAAEKTFSFLGISYPALTVISLLLFLGAMGKSAQIGLHTWLPDAMEGPTPVSALIHAATMVTAGVFMLARLSPLLEYAPAALAVVTLVGAASAVFAAAIALTQFDIKKVIAYSTISQLGFMMFAVGVSAYGAALFHLAMHAFFKALLFLAAGSVIHAMGGQQDMRKMGGLWRKLPVTYALMWVGSLALAGVGIDGAFGFSGFYSKDGILEAAFVHGSWQGYAAYGLGLLTALMTAFYSWRLIVLTFHGQPRYNAAVAAPVHESPWIMLGPLMPLALGAVFAGAALQDWFVSPPDGAFWRGALAGEEGLHAVPALARIAPAALALLGLGLALWLYGHRPDVPARLAARAGAAYRTVAAAFYVDVLYDRFFARLLTRFAAFLWHRVDEATIDRLGPEAVGAATGRVGRGAGRLQTGYAFHYALAMALAVVAMALWAMARGE